MAGRLLVLGAGLLAIGATSCSSSSADTPSSPTTMAPLVPALADTPAPLVDAATTTVESTVAAQTAAETTVPVDGNALLSNAISTLTDTYHFTTTITVDGAIVLSADGDRVGDGVRLALAAQAGIVNYIITPDGSWVMPEGGEWEQLDSAAATSDPIAALVAPSSVAVAAADGQAATLTVTVPAVSLGLAAGADVPMTCELANGQLQSVRFDSVVDGKPAVVTAQLAPVVDGSPVVAPT